MGLHSPQAQGFSLCPHRVQLYTGTCPIGTVGYIDTGACLDTVVVEKTEIDPVASRLTD
jgi:hypothetical protein